MADQLVYDNNLYRLPAQFSPNSGSTGISRQDHINTVSAGGAGQFTLGRQAFGLQLRVDNNRFAQNTSLNNTTGSGRFDWDWMLSPFLTGDAGGDLTRSLAGFSNTHFFARDIIQTTDYFGDARVRIAQHWRIGGGVRNADTTHSLEIRRNDDFRSRSGNVSIEYLTSGQDSFAFDYRYTSARFVVPIAINGVVLIPNYTDSVERLSVKYAVSGKLLLDASAGYLARRYPEANSGSFSGNVWRGSLQWQITGKTNVTLGAWRDLTAYLGSESDYFVSRGESLAPSWHPTERIEVSLSASWNDQDYLRSSPSAIAYASRHDKVRNQQVSLKFSPREVVNLQASYGLEQRDSNRDTFSYHDKVWSATLKLLF